MSSTVTDDAQFETGYVYECRASLTAVIAQQLIKGAGNCSFIQSTIHTQMSRQSTMGRDRPCLALANDECILLTTLENMKPIFQSAYVQHRLLAISPTPPYPHSTSHHVQITPHWPRPGENYAQYFAVLIPTRIRLSNCHGLLSTVDNGTPLYYQALGTKRLLVLSDKLTVDWFDLPIRKRQIYARSYATSKRFLNVLKNMKAQLNEEQRATLTLEEVTQLEDLYNVHARTVNAANRMKGLEQQLERLPVYELPLEYQQMFPATLGDAWPAPFSDKYAPVTVPALSRAHRIRLLNFTATLDPDSEAVTADHLAGLLREVISVISSIDADKVHRDFVSFDNRSLLLLVQRDVALAATLREMWSTEALLVVGELAGKLRNFLNQPGPAS